MNREQAALHMQEARRLWGERKLHAAKQEIERAVDLDPDNPSIQHGLGILALEIGDLYQGRQAFARVETLLDGRPDLRPVMLCSVRYNQGHMHYRSGELDAALSCWAEAYAEAERENMADMQRMCAQNAAWAAVEAGRVDEARTWLDLAEAHVKTTEDRYRQNLTAAYIALAEERLTDCLRLVEYLHGQADTPDDVRSFAASLAAMAAARGGMEAQARAMTAYAIEVAYQAGVDNRCWLFAAKADREVKRRFYREGAS